MLANALGTIPEDDFMPFKNATQLKNDVVLSYSSSLRYPALYNYA